MERRSCVECGTLCSGNYVCFSCKFKEAPDPQLVQIEMEQLYDRLARANLSLRDEFAIAALPGLISDGMRNDGDVSDKAATITAADAYKVADAMIEARKPLTESGK